MKVVTYKMWYFYLVASMCQALFKTWLMVWNGLQWIKLLCIHANCRVIFLLLPSRGGVCFPIPWGWVALVTCFDQWKVAEMALGTYMLLLLKSHCHVRKSSLSHWVERPHGEKKRGHMEYEKILGTRDHLDKHWATGHNHVEMSRPLWVLPKFPPTRLWEITWWVC